MARRSGTGTPSPCTVTAKRSRKSRLEAPTDTSYRPPSVQKRFSFVFQYWNARAGSVSRTSHDSPGPSATFSNAASARTGMNSAVCGAPTYTCTTSLPARRPVFFSRMVTVRSSPGRSRPREMRRPEYSNVVYVRPWPNG